MRRVRYLVYWLGFRPKFGSIFYSPSLDIALKVREAVKRIFDKNIEWR